MSPPNQKDDDTTYTVLSVCSCPTRLAVQKWEEHTSAGYGWVLIRLGRCHCPGVMLGASTLFIVISQNRAVRPTSAHHNRARTAETATKRELHNVFASTHAPSGTLKPRYPLSCTIL
ncbi:uncharacterized protein LAESUDRAFT_106367 [Laetiporus sulphureus 93-53]|uniref:Uncharacterized protein n=1 Tax=Laetiporus sulphureus 93-53 TaxID=1314785 RepID=A0A165EUN9_9APHY|nr:uncharacterized protein LAESUDRAFT_106367 [Laetiporus sulphureus 93-53]KZT07798.1 hypothetical protein LAESUDRAFT_106367 [Laetiporus sulphureus 93-53]